MEQNKVNAQSFLASASNLQALVSWIARSKSNLSENIRQTVGVRRLLWGTPSTAMKQALIEYLFDPANDATTQAAVQEYIDWHLPI